MGRFRTPWGLLLLQHPRQIAKIANFTNRWYLFTWFCVGRSLVVSGRQASLVRLRWRFCYPDGFTEACGYRQHRAN